MGDQGGTAERGWDGSGSLESGAESGGEDVGGGCVHPGEEIESEDVRLDGFNVCIESSASSLKVRTVACDRDPIPDPLAMRVGVGG